jgi:hypothetical protein
MYAQPKEFYDQNASALIKESSKNFGLSLVDAAKLGTDLTPMPPPTVSGDDNDATIQYTHNLVFDKISWMYGNTTAPPVVSAFTQAQLQQAELDAWSNAPQYLTASLSTYDLPK